MTEVYPLIGLTGHKGAGKDSTASILAELAGYKRYAWADALKRETYEAFGRALLYDRWFNLPPDHPFYEFEADDYASFGTWMGFLDEHKYDSPDSEYGWIRPMLQFWGTDYRRNLCGADYWVRAAPLGPGVVVTDCRFPNEAAAIHRNQGIMWRINRPGYTGDNHPSEVNVDKLLVDVEITASNLEELREVVERTLAQTLTIHRMLYKPVEELVPDYGAYQPNIEW